MCTLPDFLSGKVRFMHTSTTTRSHSCSEKTTRTPRVHLVLNYFWLLQINVIYDFLQLHFDFTVSTKSLIVPNKLKFDKKKSAFEYSVSLMKKIKFRIQIASYEFMQPTIFLAITFCVRDFDQFHQSDTCTHLITF